MATAAFYDGRRSATYGAPKTQNPYQPSDPRAQEWAKGWEDGQWYLKATTGELFQALKRLRNCMDKLDSTPF